MMNRCIYLFCWLCLACWLKPVSAEEQALLAIPEPGEKTLIHSDWYARKANEVKMDGNRLSAAPLDKTGWLPARVPGTVLTTLLENHMYPAPEFGLNNNLIPDIHEVGNDFYTYWFTRQFNINNLPEGRNVWLNFRGINYKAEIFLNGKRINRNTHEGMFLRKTFNITPYLRTDAPNVLAVLVYPPTHAGNPNGGQGGDGQIARNNTMQYTPGWDWIQPVRDRNTGIWDEVSITTTGPVCLSSPYVVTKVPGVRDPETKTQREAFVNTSVELENTGSTSLKGLLVCETNGTRLTQPVTLSPFEKKTVSLNPLAVKNPRLWWPNGIGEQPLYDMNLSFEIGNQVSDRERLRYGIREITSDKCPDNGGRRFFVNGQKIYVTGGNYINSDWLLRLSPERYRDEVRFHAEMNLRMIRVWGGALVERPEFYNACDEFGILVFQDLWGSGDCNGAWEDPTKMDSRERRWEYPDNHDLFIASVEDQVKMIRNHPSLCFWCGANEWPLAKDIDQCLRKEVFPRLDPERLFVSFSTDTLFTRNYLGDNGDGPYGIQEPEWFFSFRSHPFNPEAGSVGSPEVESMREMMTEQDLAGFPRKGFTRNYTWRYHKDLGYGDHLERYGEVKDIETYCKYAQVVNYDQYRSFMEGWASHMWDWYTGILIWKTQNPWTSLRGQMYDWSLDVNASLYGTRKGCEPLHAYYNPVTRKAGLLNTTLKDYTDLSIVARIYSLEGKLLWEKETRASSKANTVQELLDIPVPEGVQGAYFLRLALNADVPNIYWLTTEPKDYTSLSQLPKSRPDIKTEIKKEGSNFVGTVRLSADSQISFFNRIKVFDRETGKRILPVHYSDNYITLMPGDQQEISLEFPANLPEERIQIVVDSYNSPLP
ncbi:glycoside hydrolase family 2 TIM barrel-domain containing protein [Parabacteroides distasonis]|uniref:glycoside hydrolase family 2 protein n=1 Tax=Parabacteroides distasonis TaxID=823 RepID=UPI001899FA8C|nr:glycoside hydrolase family 2 TIM barrel-domain containing protein [Parabacteroides distasonis]MDB8996873.1 glycoside hydrolase family 2 TIM barrel-domain containing protein [Parabacteroides distasonis]MDB9070164.1 glycoside hydrolase family 2 TIM barrel-domain containing protein [Parabacteroides distasonis]